MPRKHLPSSVMIPQTLFRVYGIVKNDHMMKKAVYYMFYSLYAFFDATSRPKSTEVGAYDGVGSHLLT